MRATAAPRALARAARGGRCVLRASVPSTRPRRRQYTRPVPIYEYACMECESHFEELVRNGEQTVSCPECGAAKVLRQLSTFAVHGTSKQPSYSGPMGAGGGAGGGCCGGSCGCGH